MNALALRVFLLTAVHLMSFPVVAGWHFETTDDPMSRGRTVTGYLDSSNTIDLSFPYAGRQHGHLMLRKHPRRGFDIVFGVDRGQINCGIDTCDILIRFDDGAPVHFTAGKPNDHSTMAVFLRDRKRFMALARKARVARFQVEFFQMGSHIIVFDLAGIEGWDSLQKPR